MAAEAKAQGITFLGAPVTGSKGQATSAKLIIWSEAKRPIWKHAGLYWNALEARLFIAADKGWGLLLKW
jgi:3-hydroxyisobutyrate dehydrogenase-like beta-hydroxyacid dehydrogenase